MTTEEGSCDEDPLMERGVEEQRISFREDTPPLIGEGGERGRGWGRGVLTRSTVEDVLEDFEEEAEEGEGEGEEGEREGEEGEEEGEIKADSVLTRDDVEEDLDYFEEEEEEGEEGEREGGGGGLQMSELAAASQRRWEAEDDEENYDSPSGLPGTTPPAGSRYMKNARKGHKYKSSKKLSLGNVPKSQYRDLYKEKRPHSMIALPTAAVQEEGEEGERGRRNTVAAISVRKMRREGQRRAGEGKGGRRRHKCVGGPDECHSPHHTGDDERNLQKKKKKLNQRKINQNRDDKIAQNPSIALPLQPFQLPPNLPPHPPPKLPPHPSPKLPPHPSPKPPLSPNSPHWRPPLIPVQSVDLPDYTPSLYLAPDSPQDPLTSSLNLLMLPHRSLSAGRDDDHLGSGVTRVYRSYSDAHVSLPPAMFSTGRHQQPVKPSARCPPDRKQFFRRFQKALKYAAGISRPQPQPAETPFHPHMSRFHSENLGLENPQGELIDKVWNEIQAHLNGWSPEEQMEWIHYKSEKINRVLMQVVHFQIAPIDPMASLNTMFLAAPDYQPNGSSGSHRDGYEPVGEGEGEGEGSSTGCKRGDSDDKGSTDSSTVMTGDCRGEGEGRYEERSISEATTSLHSQPWSVDSTDDAPSTNKISPQEFLNPHQILAVAKVKELLKELETVESYFPNRRKIGDAHPQYRTLSFKRKVEALTLWLKVTEGVARALATMSGWLGVSVILPEMCRDTAEPCSRSNSNESKTVTFAGEGGRDDEGGSGILKLFSVGSPTEKNPELSLKRLASKGQSSSGGSLRSRGTLQRMFSSYQSVSIEGGMKGPYRGFVDRGLKKRSLSALMELVQQFIDPVQRLCAAALTPAPRQATEETDDASQELEKRPLLQAFLAPVEVSHMDAYHPRELAYERTTSVSALDWLQEFDSINLPHFGRQYIQLVHTPLDVMHECLKLQLGLHLPDTPSPLSVKQLVYECRDTLEEAIKVRKKYREVMEVVTRNDHCMEQVDGDMEFFESDLNKVLMIYFNYLQKWVHVTSGHILEEEWRHVKQICSHIRSGEAEAGRRFCDMAAHLLDTTGDMFESRMDENSHLHHDMEGSMEERKAANVESCRKFKELFVEVRERTSKAIGFAKMLRKDLEIAADFSVDVEAQELMDRLKASDHTQVVILNLTGKMVFVPEHMTDSVEDIQQLLSVSFAHSDPSVYLKDSYLLLVACMAEGQWTGKTLEMKTSAETTIAVSEMQIDCLKMIVGSSAHLASSRTSFLNAMGKAVTLTNEQTSSHENVATRIHDLKHAACKLAGQLIKAANQVEEQLGTEDNRSEDKTYQAAMHACFNLGFEYVRDVFRLVGEELAYRELGAAVLEYSQLWIRFVLDKCERGRGKQPRWASMGLDFLTLACAPRQLALMSPTNFESLRKLMNRTLDHVVGEAPPIMGTRSKFPQPTSTPRRPLRLRRKKPPVLVSAISDPHFRTGTMGHLREEEEEEREGEGWGGISEERGEEESEGEDVLQLESTPRADCVTFQSNSHSTDVGMEQGLSEVGVVHSPPVSTESISSGHHSPPVSHGDLSCTPSRPFISTMHTPSTHPSPSPHIHTPRTMDREESNASTASATSLYGSPYFSRTPSGGSAILSNESGGGEGDRLVNIQKEIQVLELNREKQLLKMRMIGRVKKSTQHSSHQPVRLSHLVQTHFKWQRGRKLGEGRFGKVYECRNQDTGEMMAVKQMSVQEKDSGTLQTICDEIGIFQKVSHENIVNFHGLEVYHTELYVFMEYCHEGTLWSIAQQGLPEHMIRRYTRDLLRAVDMLHDRGIIHRDIKGANIFLSNDSIKLGDFGLSVQLKNLNKTMPNEIRQQVGTVPYLSPEVVLKQEMGRPLDIWSVGCVVVEMATGKLPWSEYDHQFQIMFQIGTGKSPPIARSALCDEGHEFLSHCFQASPNERWRALELLSHPFVKVSDV